MTLEIKVFDKIGNKIKSTAAKVKAAVIFVYDNAKKLIGATAKGSGTVTGPPVKVKRKYKTKQA